MKARTVQRDGAEGGAKSGPARPLAEQPATAENTTPMPRQKTCRLGGDHASLDAGQRRFGFIERQTDHLQSVVTLVEMQDLALADHVVVVGDDPELDLRSKVGVHRLLQTRTKTLDGTLRHLFTRWYPNMAVNDNQVPALVNAA